MTPATITAIELAWWEKGRARDVALRFKGVTVTMVELVWFVAHAQGRLPSWSRPKGGFEHTEEQAKFAAMFWRTSLTPPDGWDDFIRKAFLLPAQKAPSQGRAA